MSKAPVPPPPAPPPLPANKEPKKPTEAPTAKKEVKIKPDENPFSSLFGALEKKLATIAKVETETISVTPSKKDLDPEESRLKDLELEIASLKRILSEKSFKKYKNPVEKNKKTATPKKDQKSPTPEKSKKSPTSDKDQESPISETEQQSTRTKEDQQSPISEKDLNTSTEENSGMKNSAPAPNTNVGRAPPPPPPRDSVDEAENDSVSSSSVPRNKRLPNIPNAPNSKPERSVNINAPPRRHAPPPPSKPTDLNLKEIKKPETIPLPIKGANSKPPVVPRRNENIIPERPIITNEIINNKRDSENDKIPPTVPRRPVAREKPNLPPRAAPNGTQSPPITSTKAVPHETSKIDKPINNANPPPILPRDSNSVGGNKDIRIPNQGIFKKSLFDSKFTFVSRLPATTPFMNLPKVYVSRKEKSSRRPPPIPNREVNA